MAVRVARLLLTFVTVTLKDLRVISEESGASEKFFLTPEKLTWDEAEDVSFVISKSILCRHKLS